MFFVLSVCVLRSFVFFLFRRSLKKHFRRVRILMLSSVLLPCQKSMIFVLSDVSNEQAEGVVHMTNVHLQKCSRDESAMCVFIEFRLNTSYLSKHLIWEYSLVSSTNSCLIHKITRNAPMCGLHT